MGAKCTQPLSTCASALVDRLHGLKTSGCTALGPALAISIGLTSQTPGSKIILATDGMANTGCGKIEGLGKDEPPASLFYADMARRAVAAGTSISVITMEGETCSMENLGLCADMTQVLE